MDGTVLREIYSDDSSLSDRPADTTSRSAGERESVEWEESQREEVEGRLEDLGYL